MTAKLKRFPVRLAEETLVAVSALSERCAQETQRPAPRAGVMRLLVERGLADIDPDRPVGEQLPLAELACERPSTNAPRVGPNLRARLLDLISAHPEQVYSPAVLLPMVNASKDSVRNALLVMATKGRIEKLGPGQYRACRGAPGLGTAEVRP